MENQQSVLDVYKAYLEELARTNSSDLFSNGGKEHASILMSVLFNSAQKIVRMYCNGFKPDLIRTEPYWSTLNKFLEDKNKILLVLVETKDFLNAEPLQLLKKIKSLRQNRETIIVKLIQAKDKDAISSHFDSEHCNFSVFDDNKFRFEYDPEDFKAIGSFNRKEICDKLIPLFDNAFSSSQSIIV